MGSVTCALHRQAWRGAPVCETAVVSGSDGRALRRFMRRGVHLHVFFTRVAQDAGRVAPARNLYKFSSISDLRSDPSLSSIMNSYIKSLDPLHLTMSS
ncbi:hypothetical protein A2U01_0008104 [Trifolium medium]|uniref:Uncharacterized protein n=1 Tax=Trifolium medium TaxID=97028 RepID=A0A392MKJ2_9FABA|nr:hypothetical protein [Trifolium medium]